MSEPPMKYPNPTFPLLNPRTKLIEIIDTVTGEVVAQQSTPDDLLQAKAGKLVQIRLADDTLVYVEKGISAEHIQGTHRKTYLYNHVLAEIICQKIADGMTLTKLCREPGIPPSTMIRKWRAEYPEFDKAYRIAVNARGGYYHDKVVDTAHEMEESTVGVDKEKIKAYQWAAAVGDPENFGNKTKISGDPNAPLQVIIDTGIRRPGDVGYNEDATEKLKAETLAAQTRDVTPSTPASRALPTGGGQKVPQDETDNPGDHGT